MHGRLNSPRKNSYKTLCLAILSLCVSLLLVELLVGFAFHRLLPFGNSLVNHNNPLARRGWVEYTTAMDFDADFLIIVITNSQGYQPIELEEGYYADQLEKRLNEASDKTYKVLNWAMPGARAAEYNIALTRLIDYQPDLVMISNFAENYVVHQSLPIESYSNDIIRLTYQYPYRSYLSDEFINRHSIYDPLSAILYNTNFGHLQQFVQDGLDWSKVTANPKLNPDVLYQRNDWNEDARWYVEDMYATYQRVTRYEVPLLLVSMPIDRNQISSKRYEPLTQYVDILVEYKPDTENIAIVEAIDVLNHAHFTDASHFTAQGHQAYADFLYDTLQTLPFFD